jgi:hypothetical protein
MDAERGHTVLSATTYASFLITDWFGLNSTNLNGPVPIGYRRISAGATWHGKTGDHPDANSARKDGCGRFKWKVT